MKNLEWCEALSEKRIYEELLIDKKQKVENIVKKAKDLIGIDKETGDVVIMVSRSKLRDEDLIGLHLIGKFFASELGLSESPSATVKELSEKTGIKQAVVSARLHDLKLLGYVRSPRRGEHEFIFSRMSEFLDSIRERIGLP